MLTGDRVQINKTGSELDNTRGYIMGLAVDNVVKMWIVELDFPYTNSANERWTAVVLPESCLTRI
jgi:hypothetical protein